jgi:hypothetical protein
MRALLVIIGLAAIVLLAAMAFGFINIDQTRPGVVQAPKFEASVGRVDVGMENKTVAVPKISVEKPGNTAAPTQ